MKDINLKKQKNWYQKLKISKKKNVFSIRRKMEKMVKENFKKKEEEKEKKENEKISRRLRKINIT